MRSRASLYGSKVSPGRLTGSLIVGLILGAMDASAAEPNRGLLAAAQAARGEQLALLEQIVDIDSGTGDAAGAARVQAVLAPRLQALGASIQTVPAEAAGLGDNVVASFTGTGRGRVLIIAHIDTVFPPGTAAARPFRIDGARAYGPGVDDEKAGAVEALFALKLLHDAGFRDFARITLLLETSEETGSPGTRHLIDQLVRSHDVELNIEPGDPPDVITVWRKGSTSVRITVHGRAAHAGVAPQDGRNAAVELIHQLRVLDQFPRSGEGLTANLTVLKAGERNNVIPDLATAEINVRVRTPDQLDPVMAAFRNAARSTSIPDTRVDVSSTPAFPPLQRSAVGDRLAAQAKLIYAGLGRSLEAGGNGGASESALASAAGTPALDGLGPVGGGFHSDKEYMELSTVTPRLYLLARLLMELGASPPERAP